MKIVALSGSIVGSKTKTAMEKVMEMVEQKYPTHDVHLLDLAQYSLEFSDGRNYFEYKGDTKYLTETIMTADALIIGTPIFQASIPGTLKNIFDLLPVDALRDKVASIVVTAGTSRHYLMVEQQLKPILAYMKAHVVPSYVFIEEQDFLRQEIINDDIVFRMERLVEDTVLTVEAFEEIRAKKDAEYDF
ncbi:NADPH-dependent FMN reductase [Pseudogracilibacillus auburnensis]|uniref:NAD(P)H-dependent FMN reductase n=1 Tax=Pseudogracilibacillus auburnensis TaxID=1494959 RepID=A0A2V3W755_9BACI|nr:NADPH-dependent FMN reductase [Pseudogracilibacillus auburnensis]PXW88085.1 NAD(P)H-dependent FMN reductase [Pseudogracilibacillus auburnensis]